MTQFNRVSIVKELKEFNYFGLDFIPYADFIFSDYTREIFDELNITVLKDTDIDSRMLVGVLLCGIEDDISSLFKIEELTRTHSIYKKFSGGNVFEYGTFEYFLKNCDRKLLKKLFLTSVVEFIDTDFFDLSNMVTYSDLIIPISIISVQQTVIGNNIILQGLAVSANDDDTALENILNELDETKEILADLQENIGKTGSSKTVKDDFKNTQMLLHSKYCSNENLETAYLRDFNILTKPKELAREIPKKYRKDGLKYKDEIFEKYNKLTKRHLFRIHDGYTCIFNAKSELVKSYVNNGKYNKSKVDSPEFFKELTYEYEMICNPDCPFEEICSAKNFKQKFTPLKNEMLNKFMDKNNVESYSEVKDANYQVSVQFKKIKKILHDMDYDENVVQNFLFLINTALNIRRKIKIKGTRY